jgi:lysophospholipase L1-like esterase
VAKAIQTRDRLPAGLPFRLIPNSHAVLVQCPISINSQGFRGTNIPAEKGSTFRIVALGESTTFGLTCTAGGRPWPELLEAMIRDRLKLRRPVEVINAGTASYDIEHNLVRLPLDILPLKPDLIISYHGINGFRLVDSSLPTQFGPAPPDYRRRPVELLAMAEFKVRTMLYNRRFVAELPATSALTTNVMESRYALDYRKLIGLARTNGIRLVLANYSMAVNGQSDPKVTGFYAKATPPVVWDIHANEAHSRLVAALARENPGVTFVDTHPRLDGRRDNFIDLVHFSEEGEQAMAETMFAGIRKILEEELSPAAASPDRP